MSKILHNPRCSKSRATLELLQANNIEPEIILYLEKTPSKTELTQIIKQLDITPRELLRKGEDAYKELDLQNSTDDAIITAMVSHPKLIERPIVIHNNKAKIGRPPEQVLELFQ